MVIQGLGHVTFSVSNLEQSLTFYQEILGVPPVVKGDKTVYFDVAGMWIALNEQKDIPRDDLYHSYSHIAFSVLPADLATLRSSLEKLNATIHSGRERSISGEGDSIYFRDPDGHLLEFHTGNLPQRLKHYKATNPSILIQK